MLPALVQALDKACASNQNFLDYRLQPGTRKFYNHEKICTIFLERLQAISPTANDIQTLLQLEELLKRYAVKVELHMRLKRATSTPSSGIPSREPSITIDAMTLPIFEQLTKMQNQALQAPQDRNSTFSPCLSSHKTAHNFVQQSMAELKKNIDSISQQDLLPQLHASAIEWHLYRSIEATIRYSSLAKQLSQSLTTMGCSLLFSLHHSNISPPQAFFNEPLSTILISVQLMKKVSNLMMWRIGGNFNYKTERESVSQLMERASRRYPQSKFTWDMFRAHIQFIQVARAAGMMLRSCDQIFRTAISWHPAVLHIGSHSAAFQEAFMQCLPAISKAIHSDAQISSIESQGCQATAKDYENAQGSLYEAISAITQYFKDPMEHFCIHHKNNSDYAKTFASLARTNKQKLQWDQAAKKIFNVVEPLRLPSESLPTPEEFSACRPIEIPLLFSPQTLETSQCQEPTTTTTVDRTLTPMIVHPNNLQNMPTAVLSIEKDSTKVSQNTVKTKVPETESIDHTVDTNTLSQHESIAQTHTILSRNPAPKKRDTSTKATNKSQAMQVVPISTTQPRKDTPESHKQTVSVEDQNASHATKKNNNVTTATTRAVPSTMHSWPFKFREHDRCPKIPFTFHVLRWYDPQQDPIRDDSQYSSKKFPPEIQRDIRFQHSPPLALLTVLLERGKQRVNEAQNLESRYLHAEAFWIDGGKSRYDKGVITVGRNLKTGYITHLHFSQLSPATLQQRYQEMRMYEPIEEIHPQVATGKNHNVYQTLTDESYISSIEESVQGFYAITIIDEPRQIQFIVYICE